MPVDNNNIISIWLMMGFIASVVFGAFALSCACLAPGLF